MKRKISIVTTSWDDGHKLDLKIVKMLNKHKIKGTFYIPLKYNDIKEKLSLKEIKNISKLQEVGAHTINHPDLRKISSKIAYQEISQSKKELEKIIKKKVECFAYPSGYFNQDIKSIIKKCGFVSARTVKQLDVSLPSDPFEWNTTIHACDNYVIHAKALLKLGIFSMNNMPNWDYLAKSLFDLVRKKGGIFHLWGHSWEIDEFNQWDRLENLFKYISNKKDVLYLKNSEIFKRK